MTKDIKTKKLETIVLGGGCFWCVEAVYGRVKGVESVVSGYAGGDKPNPTYEQVCSGKTGHAEVTYVTFDPQAVSLENILRIFFAVHDPTALNRQGNDIGTQYRSVIFYCTDKQRAVAEKVIKEVMDEKLYDGSIVTELMPLSEFYPAEEYHQKYFEKNPSQAYCQAVVAPKVAKLRAKYAKFYK